MSQMTTGHQPLEFSKGYCWHAFLVLAPATSLPAVLYEHGRLLGGPSFKVVLDEPGIFLEVTDASGARYPTEPAPVERGVSLHIECDALSRPPGTELRVYVNMECVATRQLLDVTLPDVDDAIVSIGSDIRGEHPATFTLAELVTNREVEGSDGDQDRARYKLHQYFRRKYLSPGAV